MIALTGGTDTLAGGTSSAGTEITDATTVVMTQGAGEATGGMIVAMAMIADVTTAAMATGTPTAIVTVGG
ncbi:MAG TPA: hypothetical protein VGO22_10380 [Pseudorhizobium sp.]|nr:hypothetical protein [Pseudorhizobium sp.]